MEFIPTHYEVLGVAHDAPIPDIRASYRARARLHHPDRTAATADRPGGSMAEINEAYRVLSDPGRRAIYDERLARSSRSGGPAGTAPDRDDDVAGDLRDDPGDVPPVRSGGRPSRLSPDGPARYPWKALLVVGLIGSALVLLSAAFADPPAEETPDGIIRIDSCVAIEPNGDAREVACTGEDDIVVGLFIPIDARCPVGMQPHRDRLGLGVACIVP